MIESLIEFLRLSVVPLGAIGIFIASIIETLVAPIPSAIVLYTSGFLFLSGLSGFELAYSLFFIVAIPAAAGATIGSFLIYGLGYAFGKLFFDRWGKWVGVSWEEIEQIRERFSRGPRDEIMLGVFRAIPIIPSVALTGLAGVIRMNFLGYTIATFLGTIARAAILAVVGAGVGTVYENHTDLFTRFEGSIIAVFAIVVLAYVFLRRAIKRNLARPR